jgi:sulfotransferase family protein
MSANVILESTRQETRNRRWATVAAISVIGFFVNVIMFVVEMIDRQKLKLELRSYIPHSDDIFIVTYPRSGTTLVQMILYQLLTDGEMDFAHIQEWSPFYESRIQDGQSFEDFPSPRVFKSHLYYKLIPKGPCKYIYIARNGKDVAVSAFHFSQTHMGAKMDFGTFFDLFVKGKYRFGSWFNVMFLTYEELTRDREQAIRKIIDFCGKKVDPEKFSRIMERSSFAFMKQHEEKFDSLLGRALDFNFKTGSFIRKAQAGQWKEYLSSEQEELFQRRFTEHLNTLSAELKDNIR